MWVDGDDKLARGVRAEAKKLGIPVTLVLDFIHALEYLWRAAHAFHAEGTDEIEAWVLDRLERVLEGKTCQRVSTPLNLVPPARCPEDITAARGDGAATSQRRPCPRNRAAIQAHSARHPSERAPARNGGRAILKARQALAGGVGRWDESTANLIIRPTAAGARTTVDLGRGVASSIRPWLANPILDG